MQDSCDFIFFNPEPRNGSVEFVERLGISCQLREDPLGFIVVLPDSIDDKLPDGRSCMAPLEVDVAHRLLASLFIEEVQQLFQNVIDSAQSAESDRPLCQTLRAAAHERNS